MYLYTQINYMYFYSGRYGMCDSWNSGLSFPQTKFPQFSVSIKIKSTMRFWSMENIREGLLFSKMGSLIATVKWPNSEMMWWNEWMMKDLDEMTET